MDFIVADDSMRELGYLDISKTMDIDIGETNEFEITLKTEEWMSFSGGAKNCLFYAPDTEYGGMIACIYTPKGQKNIVLSGDTWRGMLGKKIIQPPAGEDYRTVSGDAHTIMKGLLDDAFGTLFLVPATNSGIVINNYSFDRYTDVLTGLTKMLLTQDARLDIKYRLGHPGYVEVRAVKIVDYSNQKDYSADDDRITFSTREVRNGINHLICLGGGELKERQVAHLYVSKYGKIVDEQVYTGQDERVAIYDYGSAESMEELIKYGKERLRELMNYKQFDITVDDLETAEIGDIVGGRERTTGFLIRQQITQKIIQVDDDKATIEHVVGGNTRIGIGDDNSVYFMVRPNDPEHELSVTKQLLIRVEVDLNKALKIYP